MIDGIRRVLAGPSDSETWDVDQQLEPEPDEDGELSSPEPALISGSGVEPLGANEVNAADYYKDLVKAAMENGGRYAGHCIPIPWLRMIMAGLEWRHVDPETMWYGFEADLPDGEPLQEIPPYNDLFPCDRSLPAVP